MSDDGDDRDIERERFMCDTCGQFHPLIEHRDCRAKSAAAIAAQARQAITKGTDDRTDR